MGREIIFEVRDKGKAVWPDPNNIDEALYVCGRDDATEYMARLVQNKINDILDSNSEMTVDNLPDEAYSVLLSANDYNRYLKIKENLKEYYDKDMFEINKAKETLSDLREARRHCTTYDEFVKFSEAMDDTHDWIEDNDWSRAGHLIECLDKCYDKMLDLVNDDPNEDRQSVIERYKVAIIWSE